MLLESMVIPVAEAKERLAEYRAALRHSRDVEDAALAAAFRAAARGLPVISLSQTVQAGGFFEDNGLPRIAVVRAGSTNCAVNRWWNGQGYTFYDQDSRHPERGALVGAHHVSVRVQPPGGRFVSRAVTVVPAIPPRHRPQRGRLDLFHVLWEVEKWDPTPPVDPALLRHIRGDLWAVVATWNLTEIERAVLAQRSRP